jgi:hypothetical protein
MEDFRLGGGAAEEESGGRRQSTVAERAVVPLAVVTAAELGFRGYRSDLVASGGRRGLCRSHGQPTCGG